MIAFAMAAAVQSSSSPIATLSGKQEGVKEGSSGSEQWWPRAVRPLRPVFPTNNSWPPFAYSPVCSDPTCNVYIADCSDHKRRMLHVLAFNMIVCWYN